MIAEKQGNDVSSCLAHVGQCIHAIRISSQLGHNNLSLSVNEATGPCPHGVVLYCTYGLRKLTYLSAIPTNISPGRRGSVMLAPGPVKVATGRPCPCLIQPASYSDGNGRLGPSVSACPNCSQKRYVRLGSRCTRTPCLRDVHIKAFRVPMQS